MKKLVRKLLTNKVFRVIKGSLKGLKLKVTDLVHLSVFYRSYEPDKQQAFRLLVKPGDTFFDVGANIGLHSYFIARGYPGAKIYSFEPFPDNVAYIKDALNRNSFSNIQVVEAAVAAEGGEAFFEDGDDCAKGKLSDKQTSRKVKLVSLDEFASNSKIWPDILKVDVEGAESEVLRGAEKVIANKKPVFIIELHNPAQDLKVSEFLDQHQYEIYRLNPLAGENHKKQVLLPIRNLKSSWPDPEGVWGSIVAIHRDKLRNYKIN